MTAPTTLRFSKFVVAIENVDGSGTYTAPCGFTQKSLKLAGATSSVIVPDCDDPEAAAWTQKAVSSLSGTITGSGILAMESLSVWRAWFASGASKNVRLTFNLTGANGGGYYQGEAILSDFTADVSLGSEGNRVKVSVTIENDGVWAWTDAA